MTMKIALHPLDARLGLARGTLHGLLEAVPKPEADAALLAALRGDLEPLRGIVAAANRP